MSFNEQLPKWENPGVEPPESKKTDGWEPTEKPPAQWFNWLFNRIYKVLEEIRSKFTTHEIDNIAHGTASKVEAQAGTSHGSYMTPLRTKEAIQALESVSSVAGKKGVVTVTKSDVGLGNVDNIKQATKVEFDAHKAEYASRFKIVNFGRDASIAGAQQITNIGFKPRLVLFLASVDGVAGCMSIGVTDGVLNYTLTDRHNIEANSYGIAGVSIRLIRTSSDYISGTCSFIDGGFEITWAKTGTPTGSINIVALAIR